MSARGPIAVAVSGGMDSLYALARLREEGHSLLALHARLLSPALAPPGYEAMLERLAASCAALGVPLHIADCVARFDDAVIAPFIRAYAAGTTPNPCALCNARIKFGLLQDLARQQGANTLATGHYAALAHLPDGTPALFSGADTVKDQSYFLSLVPGERLRHALFPLAETTKDTIRAYLAERGLTVPSPGESQEICFVPNDDYRSFVTNGANRLGLRLSGPGPVCLPDGTPVGKHAGLWRYTEGQRRGLGIAWREPLYVLAKDLAANTLRVGVAADLTGGPLQVDRLNYLVPQEEWPQTVYIRTRYRQAPRAARVEQNGDILHIHEDAPAGPHAAGQLATIYAPDAHSPETGRLRVLGGGIIL